MHIQKLHILAGAYTYIYIYIHIHTHIHTYTYAYIYIYIHMHIHTYTFTYIYIYIHTHVSRPPSGAPLFHQHTPSATRTYIWKSLSFLCRGEGRPPKTPTGHPKVETSRGFERCGSLSSLSLAAARVTNRMEFGPVRIQRKRSVQTQQKVQKKQCEKGNKEIHEIHFLFSGPEVKSNGSKSQNGTSDHKGPAGNLKQAPLDSPRVGEVGQKKSRRAKGSHDEQALLQAVSGPEGHVAG